MQLHAPPLYLKIWAPTLYIAFSTLILSPRPRLLPPDPAFLLSLSVIFLLATLVDRERELWARMEEPMVLVIRVVLAGPMGGGEWEADEDIDTQLAHRKRINDIRIAHLISFLTYQNTVIDALDTAIHSLLTRTANMLSSRSEARESSASRNKAEDQRLLALLEMLDRLCRSSELKRGVTEGQLGLARRIGGVLGSGSGLLGDEGVERLVREGEEELADVEAEELGRGLKGGRKNSGVGGI